MPHCTFRPFRPGEHGYGDCDSPWVLHCMRASRGEPASVCAQWTQLNAVQRESFPPYGLRFTGDFC